MIRKVLAAVTIAATAALGGVLVLGGSSGAATLSCPNFNDTDIPTPPAGQTGYLFIGTSISTSTSTLSGTLAGGGSFGPITGEQKGNGSFHYIVNLPQGATVTNATVTGATENTVVTVSGCLNGPPVVTTPTTPTTVPITTPTTPPTTGGPTPTTTPGGTTPVVTTPPVTQGVTPGVSPAAPVPVRTEGRFTG